MGSNEILTKNTVIILSIDILISDGEVMKLRTIPINS